MDHIIAIQPADKTDEAKKGNFFSQSELLSSLRTGHNSCVVQELPFLSPLSVLLSGTFIGLMIGVYRTAPKAANKFVALSPKTLRLGS